MATVLIADDDSLIRMVLRMAIEQRGHRVLEAENSDDFLVRITADGIDLCIMDAAMPGASLHERLEALEAQSNTVDVVVMSGYSRPPDVVEEHRVRFLSKPIELATLDGLLDDLAPATDGVGE